MIMKDVMSGYWKEISQANVGCAENEVQNKIPVPERGKLGDEYHILRSYQRLIICATFLALLR
jgi:hypothetical protein